MKVQTVSPMLHSKPWRVDGPHECKHQIKGKHWAHLVYCNIVDSNGFFVMENMAEQEAREIVEAVNAAWKEKK